MATPTAADRRAAQRWGRKLEQAGVSYTNPVTGKPLSGAALLLKTASGESGFNDDATSGAGAHGRLQFMPGTRQAVLKATGGKVDPYGSIDEAYHAAYLHLAGKLGHRKGLEGYNPGGGQEYVNYILGQKVGSPGRGRPSSSSVSSSSSGGGTSSPRTVNIPSAVVQSDTDSSSALALIQAMSSQSQQKAAPSSMGVAAPTFAAGPAGGQTLSVQGGGGPGPKGPDISALLSAVASAEQGGTQEVGEGQTVSIPTGVSETADRLGTQEPGKSGGASAAVDYAKGRIGTKEQGGNNRGDLPDYLNQRFGFGKTGAQPWCAMFTSVATTKGGAPLSARTASVAEVRKKATQGTGYQRGFIEPSRAKEGDLILFGNDHIGMVEKVTDEGIVMIAGNDSNKVQRRTVALNSGDIVRPKYGARR